MADGPDPGRRKCRQGTGYHHRVEGRWLARVSPEARTGGASFTERRRETLSKVAFKQADLERVIRAARRENAVVQIDLKTYVVTVFPSASPVPERPDAIYRGGGIEVENWDD